MSNRSNDLGASVDLKFDTDKIKLRVKEILNTDPVQKQAFMKHKKFKITLIAAAGLCHRFCKRRPYIIF